MDDVNFLEPGDGRRIAYRRLPGDSPGLMFMPGFRSDMEGTKALRLWSLAERTGQACTLFDYTGHGRSSGGFEDGTIGQWSKDAIDVLDVVAKGPQVLIGSSMGGWMMLLAALARPERVVGMIGIASAPDFTETLMRPAFTKDQWKEMDEAGQILLPSIYGDPTPVTRKLLEDGREHLVMTDRIDLTCPTYLLHGQQDPDVPWETSITLAAKLASDRVTVELVKDGDHRLSREEDLSRLDQLVKRMIKLLREQP